MIAVGLMSGTSLDGIDAALVRIRPSGERYRIDLFNFRTEPFEPELRALLLQALPPSVATAAQIAALNKKLGEAFARAALEAAGDLPLDYVATHGMTVFHDGGSAQTLQIGDPYVLRDRTQATVCFDFRGADCAAGGQGAPLVPYADALLLADAHEDRVAVNVGGIANLTVLRKGAEAREAVAFDSGPGNMLIDAFVRARTGGAEQYDKDGAYASRGRADRGVLDAMLADPYFAMPAPKSTGRERFGDQFLAAHRQLDSLGIEDGCATLTELTAATLTQAIASAAARGTRVIVSGGGAHNVFLMDRLAQLLPASAVEPSSALGVNPDAKEAIAFAVLGYELLRERPANLPNVTGAAHPTVLGAIAPHELLSLLSKVQSECRR